MCVTLYDEFLGDKGLGLLRGDVSHHLTREVCGSVGGLMNVHGTSCGVISPAFASSPPTRTKPSHTKHRRASSS
jgi:hypothetical protein